MTQTPLQRLKEEVREQMIKLLDDPRTGLKLSSNTNKTRMELLGLVDSLINKEI